MKIIIFFIIILIFGCKNNPTEVEVEVEKIIEKKSPLQFSSTAYFAVFAANNPWTFKDGMIMFVKAFNSSDSTWYGTPELSTYVFVPNQDAPGKLISTGRGIMMSGANQSGVPVPVDTLANEIPGKSIRRTLTFAPVDWSKHLSGAWVYWKFVEQNDQTDQTAKTIKKRAFNENRIYISNPTKGLK